MNRGKEYYNEVMGNETREETKQRSPFYNPTYAEKIQEGFDMIHKNDMEEE